MWIKRRIVHAKGNHATRHLEAVHGRRCAIKPLTFLAVRLASEASVVVRKYPLKCYRQHQKPYLTLRYMLRYSCVVAPSPSVCILKLCCELYIFSPTPPW